MITTRNDLQNTHEEADVVMVNQMVPVAVRDASNISVVCDDTDVLVLLVHFYCKLKLVCGITMKSPIVGRDVIDIKATANNHMDITDSARTSCVEWLRHYIIHIWHWYSNSTESAQPWGTIEIDGNRRCQYE